MPAQLPITDIAQWREIMIHGKLGFSAACLSLPLLLTAGTRPAGEWYRDAVAILHCDNHSSLLAQGQSVDEICEWLKEIPVSSVQVSAYGAVGDRVTYPSAVVPELNYPDLDGWDTLDVWRRAVLKSGRRFHVYINTRGFKIHKSHPDWMQCDAEGRGSGRAPGLYDACPRPSNDGDGYLEKILLPMVREIAERYQPGAFWVDGDHARTQTCYCRNCRAAWRQLSGGDAPPLSAADPEWPRWLRLQQDRYDTYRLKMAAAAHAVDPDILYASNHSWHKMMGDLWTKHDPRSAPEGIDYYTADLSHGQSLKQTRIYAMLLSAEEELPGDIMHSVYSPHTSLTRIMQQGAVALTCGGPWNLWIGGTSITQPEARERAIFCASFAAIRSGALGRTSSLNRTAVLVSETAWLDQRVGGREGAYKPAPVVNTALALQDSGYAVDIINERILANRLNRYAALVVPEQHRVEAGTLSAIRSFVDGGGILIWSGNAQLAGMESRALVHADLTQISYPDAEGAMARVMRSAGRGPDVRQSGEGVKPHLIYAFRRKNDATVVHITDITSRIGGKKVLPDKSDAIDPEFPIRTLNLELACPLKPAGVTAACARELRYRWKSRIAHFNAEHPDGLSAVLPVCSVAHRWQDGILSLTVSNFTTHAALIIESAGTFSALPEETPRDAHIAYLHYRNIHTLESDFESEMHGHLNHPLQIFTISERYRPLIELSDKNPASGKGCLVFRNNPQLFPYTYVYARPAQFNTGTMLFSIEMRVEAGTSPWIDFRETPSRKTHPVGPSVRVRDGKLIADGQGALCDFEPGQWHRIEMTLPFDGSGRYSLTLTKAGGEQTTFSDLPCVSGAQFTSCGWVGVIAAGAAGSEFAIDNFRLELVKNREN
jgi:hypothetical protein